MPAAPAAPTDEAFMRLALRMARRGLGTTMPNPAVGAVLVDPLSGEVLARGWTQPGGRPHAETEAIRRAGASAKGATLCVTLEPCSHHGMTPPCAEAVIAAGIGRVVVAGEDPDQRVAGRGLAMLRAAGIEVMTGVCAEAGWWMNAGHILRVTRRRPFVQLKMAATADGHVPKGRDGAPVWITGPDARARVHLLRAEADAILVGRRTFEDDDPELTCRLPGMARRTPIRIVADSGLGVLDARHRSSKLLRSASPHMPVWIACAGDVAQSRADEAGQAGVSLIPVSRAGAGTDAGIDLNELFGELADRGVTRLMVEGGPSLAGSLLAADLVDECVVFSGPKPLEPGVPARPVFGRLGLDTVSASAAWRLVDVRSLGADSMQTYRSCRHFAG